MGAVCEASEAIQLAFNKLEELTRQYGPQALELAAEVKRVGCASSLVGGAVTAVLALGAGFAAFKLTKRAAEIGREWKVYWRTTSVHQPERDDTFAWAVAIAPSVVTVVLAVNTLLVLTDVWTWVGVINPKLALAHDVLAKIGVAQ